VQKFHGFVLIINTLLPAIVALALVVVYFLLVAPMIDDYRQMIRSFSRVETVATAVGAQYDKTSTAVEKHIANIQGDFAPIIGLYDGVHKLSENFCGNIGNLDLSALPVSRLQVAQLVPHPMPRSTLMPSSADAVVALSLPDPRKALRDGLEEADRLREQAERAARDVWKQIRGGGEEALRFGRTSTCKATEAAFEGTFTVLGSVMSPFDDIDQVIRELERLYGTLEIDTTLPEIGNIRARAASVRSRVGKLLTVLAYLGLALLLWSAIPYVSWALSRLQRGWGMVKR
jgi:hypothetical protein